MGLQQDCCDPAGRGGGAFRWTGKTTPAETCDRSAGDRCVKSAILAREIADDPH
jgi:hypothetical protein